VTEDEVKPKTEVQAPPAEDDETMPNPYDDFLAEFEAWTHSDRVIIMD